MTPEQSSITQAELDELGRRVREHLADPAFRRSYVSPPDRRWGAALPGFLRSAPDESTGPKWIRPVSRIVQRFLRDKVTRGRIRAFAALNGWKHGKPFVLAALIDGTRSRHRHRRNPHSLQCRIGEGPHSHLFRHFECFYHNGIPVAVLAFPYADAPGINAQAASLGLDAHLMPPEGKYWPQNGSPRGNAATVAFTRPGVTVNWPTDSAAPEFSADSPEYRAEMERLEAALPESDDSTLPNGSIAPEGGASAESVAH